MKLHRAIVLVLMMVLGVGIVVLLTASGIANFAHFVYRYAALVHNRLEVRAS